MMIVLRKTVIVVKVVRKKTSGQVFKSSYCNKQQTGAESKAHWSHDQSHKESGRERERGGIRGFARLGGHS